MNHRPRPQLVAVRALLRFAGAGALGFILHACDSAEPASLERLAEVVGDHRLTRARLTGGFMHAHCQIDSTAKRLVRGLVCEGPPPTSWPSARKLEELAHQMRRGGSSGAVPVDARTTGVWNLLWGRADDAVADLRSVVRRDPRNARAQNDLAVALMALAQRNDDPAALIDAFVAADSAVRLDPSLPEGQFTLAVVLEHLYLPTEAVAAWKQYLQLDADSPWAAEARRGLAHLQRPVEESTHQLDRLRRALATSDDASIRSMVKENPTQTRLLIHETLGAWGAAAGHPQASDSSRSLLDIARLLADQLRAATGDALLSNAVGAIDQAVARDDQKRIRVLAAGHAALKHGTELFESAHFTTANARLSEARRLLAFGGSPMSAWATLYVARSQLIQNERDSALYNLRAIRDSTPAEYLVLRSYAARWAGLIYDFRSDYVRVVAAYDSAVNEGRPTREPEIAIRLGAWLAEKTTILRGREAGWRVLYAALAVTPQYPASYRSLQSVFSGAALSTSTDAPRLSLLYGEESIRNANKLLEPIVIAVAFTKRAEQLARMRQTDLARAAVDSVDAAAQKVIDPTQRAVLLSDANLVRGLVALRASPAQAEATLDEVVNQYRTSDYRRGLVAAYLYLAQSRIASAHAEGARAAFDSAMAETEHQRATVQDPDERVEFLDNARAVVDQIVAFRADGRDSSDAFEFFEHTRSRVLLEQLTERRGRRANETARNGARLQLQRRLPRDALVLSYAVLPSETLIWIVGRDRFEMHRVPVTSSEVELLVAPFRQSNVYLAGEAGIAASSKRLYQLLIAPVNDLEPETRLIVIPDKWLHFVPFAALRDTATSRYLVQDHELSYASSATLLVESLARGESRSNRSSRVLAVGNPALDSGAFGLQSLPAAEREVRSIAASYASATKLLGQAATDAALENMAPTFDVLHFAGHAVVRTDAPQMSHLVLASDGESDGVVFSREIARWNLSHTTLAVLSACSTSGGRLSATEGASSLARAFFAAGVPAVIASLWAVGDEDTADFFTAFHRRLAGGERASTALRTTQVQWISRADARAHSMSTWAAFQFFGR